MLMPINPPGLTSRSAGIFYGGTSDTSIRNAMALALSFGGGTVQLPPASITLASPLVPVSGVEVRGTPPKLTFSTDLPDAEWTYAAGTRLLGDGTFAAFQVNEGTGVPASPYPSNAPINCGISDMVLDTFTYGLRMGGSDNAGPQHSRFHNLWIRNCGTWGVDLQNYMHCEISQIQTHLCQNGQRYACNNTTATLATGNSWHKQLFNLTPRDGRDSRLCRNIVFEALGTRPFNEIHASRIQCNAFNKTLLSVTAGFTNGSADITVPDGTKFAVGMPIVFATTANGVTANICYVVRSVVSNVIQVATKRDTTQAVVTASGTGNVTLNTYGFPNLELVGKTAGLLPAARFYGVDVEGNATAAVYMENVTSAIVDIQELPGTKHWDVVCRSAGALVWTPNAILRDFDSASGGGIFGTIASSTAGQRTGYGIWRNTTLNTGVMSLNSGGTDELGNFHQAGGFTRPGIPLGEKIQTRDSTITLSGVNVGSLCFNGASGQTFTLPIIVDADSNPTTATLGSWFEIHNVSANSLSIATQSSQLINLIAARTTATIAAAACKRFTACKTAGGTLYWKAEIVAMET